MRARVDDSRRGATPARGFTNAIRSVVNPELWARASFAAYRYRFLFTYVVIGVLSLAAEVVIYRAARRLGVAEPFGAIAGVSGGILFAYWGNVRFNFKVPVGKRARALYYFAAISVLSWSVQFLLRRQIADSGLSYEQARFMMSGSVFALAYVLHRRFSFSDYKKVGVAVYANSIENIEDIHRRIENCADIIHVDVVDASYGRKDHEVRTYRLEAVRAYWPRRPLHVHLMSRAPSRYLEDLYPHVDRIYVHVESDEPVDGLVRSIQQAGREAGIAISLSTPLESIRPYLDGVSGVLFLAIAEPGRSGQPLQPAVLERIADFNKWAERSRLDVCVDGGVTERNVGLLQVEIVVSGSSVLMHPDPRRQIMRLQTSSNYEQA
jgi:ribulose-phosphate 3-epimerase